MKFLTLVFIGTISALTLFSISFAGHYYHHGHGCMGQFWKLDDLDTSNDSSISFDEFKEAHTEQLRKTFDMLDMDSSGEIEASEYDEFLRVHGMKKDE
jgi:hypothetical protein